ncbi:HD domain-containing protein [Litoribacillus peritrichatus]|uniref:HD domain-containing protein n=1 Tax=Litoribacillus peritrichatus TaxID=718191 RepID=A0ABP7MC85_9GAMM
MNTNLEPKERQYQAIAALFEAYGDEQYGEAITQKEHMLQCAFLADQEGASDALVIAALLHDVGHFIGPQNAELIATGTPGEDFHHEVLGARYLKQFFGPEVTTPIQLHVAAKRYLCSVDEAYEGALSEASQHSLKLQGGAMTVEQVQKFQSSRYFNEALKVRYYDDQGKIVGLDLPGLSAYKERMIALMLNKVTPEPS